MGYYADSIEQDFTIPPENVPAALEAINNSDNLRTNWHTGTYTDLITAVQDMTCFEDSYIDEYGFNLGHHTNKYLSYTDKLLEVLAPFATEGSYVRFNGEGGELFGFQVSGGKLLQESGVIQWTVYG